MDVELVSLDSLTPDPNNARGHEKGLPEIAASLREFGQLKPAVVWGADSVVMAGNGLLEAAKSLGWTQLAITRTPDDWPYEKAQAFALADNKTAEMSEWNFPVLTDLRYSLEAVGWETTQFGFEPLAVPNFLPSDEPQPRLDERNPVECPECHYRWRVAADGKIITVS